MLTLTKRQRRQAARVALTVTLGWMFGWTALLIGIGLVRS